MKKQKSSLLQRMIAVQLCMVLVAGMVFTAAPVTVLAQEPAEGQENVSGNDVGAERVKEPESTDDPESMVIEGVTQDADIASGTDWVLDGSGKLTISSDAGMVDWHEKKEDINTWYEPMVTSVEIKNGVTSIVADAFLGCRYMTSITIPEGVASIGSAAFSNCEGLTSIVLPESVTSIGNDAFVLCKGLTSIAIPEGVTTLETNTFNYCESLTSVTIPESMIYISWGVFSLL